MFKKGDQVFNTIALAWDAGQTDVFEIGTIFEVVSGNIMTFTDGSEGMYCTEISTLRMMAVPLEYMKINTKISRLLYLGE